jgi:hypothetical protein
MFDISVPKITSHFSSLGVVHVGPEGTLFLYPLVAASLHPISKGFYLPLLLEP